MTTFQKTMILLIVLLFTTNNSLYSQAYEPFVESNKVWTQSTSNYYFNPYALYDYTKYSFVGDTVISGMDYKKMYSVENSLTFDIDNASYVYAMREENKRVYICRPNTTNEFIYVDFSLDTGDFVNVFSPDAEGYNLEVEVLFRDSIEIENGESRARIGVEHVCGGGVITESWIEGIGSNAGIVRSLDQCYLADVGYSLLICQEENNDLVYKVNGANSCSQAFEMYIYDEYITDFQLCEGQSREVPFELFGGTLPYAVTIEPEVGIVDLEPYYLEVSPESTTTYTLSFSDLTGQIIERSFTVFVDPSPILPVEILTDNPSGECFPDSMILYADNVYSTYQWTDYFGNIISTNSTAWVYDSGTYYLTVTNAAGCEESDNIGFIQSLNDNPFPNIKHNYTNFICDGDTLIFYTEEPYADYQWSTGDQTDTIMVIADINSSVGYVYVYVTDERGCSGPPFNVSVGYTIYQIPDIPTIAFTNETLVSDLEFSHQWYYNNEPIAGATSNEYIPKLAGTYFVEVGNEAGCTEVSEDFPISQNDIQVFVDISMILEGAYHISSNKMVTDLLDYGLLPINQPYNIAPWNYAGTESVASLLNFPSNTVDWVLVEARTGTPQEQGSPGTNVIEVKAGLLLSNGKIVDPMTNGLLNFTSIQSGSEYYFSVRHRNHLDVLSREPIIASACTEYDFTSSIGQAFGSIQMKSVNNRAVLFAGDFNQDSNIQITDFDDWKIDPAINQSYEATDGTLDGIVQVTDYDIWYINRSKLGIAEFY